MLHNTTLKKVQRTWFQNDSKIVQMSNKNIL